MYTYGYLFYIPINLFLSAFFLFSGLRNRKKPVYYLFVTVFCIYLNLLIERAFFPIFTIGARHYTRITDYMNWNIMQLMEYTPYQIVGNILLTFPIGILLPFIVNKKNKGRLGIAVCLAVAIEFVQLGMIGTLHLMDVSFDINDILLNVFGCFFGHFIFLIFCKIYVQLPREECRNSILFYFNHVCDNCACNEGSLSGLMKEKGV